MLLTGQGQWNDIPDESIDTYPPLRGHWYIGFNTQKVLNDSILNEINAMAAVRGATCYRRLIKPLFYHVLLWKPDKATAESTCSTVASVLKRKGVRFSNLSTRRVE